MIWSKSLKMLVAVSLISLVALIVVGCPGPARKPARGEPTVRLYLHETGKIENLKMENYIHGVVAAEMAPTWPVNALGAQAILARTFTMNKMEEGGLPGLQADASTDVEKFQAYSPARINTRVRQAVDATRGEVVTQGGNYIKAWFHADAGGKTAASAAEGLDWHEEKAPYIKSVPDPGASITEAQNKNWTADFSWEEVRRVGQKTAGNDPGPTPSVEVLERGPSGRVTKLKLGQASVSGAAFRLALGPDKLRSTLWTTVEIKEGRLTVQGKGYGHGVGMSQWGARALADQGSSPEDIINYFFDNVQITRAWR